MIRDQFPNLEQFCAYFHEDWDLDDPTASAVIERYLKEAKPSHVEKTFSELSQFLEMKLTELELSQVLMFDLACNYDPTCEGKTHQEWLEWLQANLQKSLLLLMVA